MDIPIETRAETAREKIRGLGLQDPGLGGFLAKVDRALARSAVSEQETDILSIERDLARWAKIEKRR